MAVTWRGGLLLAGLLCALAVTACGTSVATRDTRYAGRLQSAQQRFTVGVTQVLAATVPGTAHAATVAAVGRYESALAEVEVSLRSTRAPETVSRLHRRLLATIDRYGAEVRRMVAALRIPAGARLAASEARFRSATARASADVQDSFRRIASMLAQQRGAMP